MEEFKIVKIKEEPCELYKVLKLGDLVQSGGQAKFVISEGQVKLNGEIETRKRKKIILDDIIEFDGIKIKVSLDP